MTRSAKGTRDNPSKNVKAKSGLNRSILTHSWGLFTKRLTDKATNATEPTTAINPAYTSLRCSECGYTDKRSQKNQAIFCCLSYVHTNNADINVAKNILAAGLTVTRRGGTPHTRSNKTQHNNLSEASTNQGCVSGYGSFVRKGGEDVTETL